MYKILLDEYMELDEIENMVKSKLKNAPQGSLIIMNKTGRAPQYYLNGHKRQAGKPNGTYIRKENKSIALELAQKDYNLDALKAVTFRKRTIEKCLRAYKTNGLDVIYTSLSPERQKLVQPIELPDSEYIEKWKASKMTGANTYEIEGNRKTINGEIVRSKTEKFIADKLHRAGIPYVYEPKLVFADGSWLFPDFAILNVRLRKEFYWEHFGSMDDPDYSARTVEKLDKYAANGFLQGINLLYTFETAKRMPDDRALDIMIQTYLK